MNEIKICIEFKGGKGYAYINLTPTNYSIYKQDFSGCHNFTLKKGDYSCVIDGVSPVNGTVITISGDSIEPIQRTITSAGHFSRIIIFSL